MKSGIRKLEKIKNAYLKRVANYYLKILIVLFLAFIFSVSTVCADDVDYETENYNILQEEIDITTKDISKNANEISATSSKLSKEPTINSRKCAIYDRKSKRVIYGKNEDVKCAMASTTKIMTATIVLENADLNKQVEITLKAAGTGGSRLGLKTGDKITIRDLLYGLMLRSGNDAAVALAIEVGGSVEGFSELMNEKARELGLKKTNFVTPHGLDNPEHYTTATELALLTDYALSNDIFKNIVATKNYTITINGYPKALTNTNELLGVLDGVVGVKTGFTNGAGRCLVTETIRGDRDLITVVLGADTKKDRTKDSVQLINFGFGSFKEFDLEEEVNEFFNEWCKINSERITLIKAKEEKVSLKMSELKTKTILLQEKDINKFEYEINSIVILEAPVLNNTKVGNISIRLNDEIIDQVDIILKNDIKKKEWHDYLREFCRTILKYFNRV